MSGGMKNPDHEAGVMEWGKFFENC
jgi:hypothetical protein